MSINSSQFTCSKTYEDFPCSHRQWRHKGHCRFVHGYSRSFTFWFAAKQLDKNGFVVDFSDLKPLKDKLEKQFDHTFLVNKDDPLLREWENLHNLDALDLRIMENVGMEFTSKLIWKWANEYLKIKDNGRTCCWKTESKENKSNRASYEQIPDWFNN
tara:strand:+ start:2435 stop:2905 length:471 start_codon:yes stop_codon:yes gene_type:complete